MFEKKILVSIATKTLRDKSIKWTTYILNIKFVKWNKDTSIHSSSLGCYSTNPTVDQRLGKMNFTFHALGKTYDTRWLDKPFIHWYLSLSYFLIARKKNKLRKLFIVIFYFWWSFHLWEPIGRCICSSGAWGVKNAKMNYARLRTKPRVCFS